MVPVAVQRPRAAEGDDRGVGAGVNALDGASERVPVVAAPEVVVSEAMRHGGAGDEAECQGGCASRG